MLTGRRRGGWNITLSPTQAAEFTTTGLSFEEPKTKSNGERKKKKQGSQSAKGHRCCCCSLPLCTPWRTTQHAWITRNKQESVRKKDNRQFRNCHKRTYSVRFAPSTLPRLHRQCRYPPRRAELPFSIAVFLFFFFGYFVRSLGSFVLLFFFFYCSPRTSWLVTTQKKRNEREGEKKKKTTTSSPPLPSDVGPNEMSSKSDANHDLENRAKKKRKRKAAHCLQPKKKRGWSRTPAKRSPNYYSWAPSTRHRALKSTRAFDAASSFISWRGILRSSHNAKLKKKRKERDKGNSLFAIQSSYMPATEHVHAYASHALSFVLFASA